MPFSAAPYPVPQKIPPLVREGRSWFAVYTRSHHEKRVAENLTQREIENFLPRYQAVHRWTHDRRVSLDLPLFPNYLFVRIAPQERVRVLGVGGVISLVGSSHGAMPIRDIDIDILRTELCLRNFEPHPYLAAGSRARIIAGPLTGMHGVVQRWKGGLRVVLAVDIIMQSVAVEVDASEVEPYAGELPS